MFKKLTFFVISGLVVTACSSNAQSNVTKFFTDKKLVGSITIYDLKNDKWVYSDKKDSQIKLLPASTFKVLNTLIALEEKVIKINDIVKWDGRAKKFKGNIIASWNSDSDIEKAFKNSTIWFYEALSKQIPRRVYKSYLHTINYGNNKIEQKGNDFWNYGSFAVSPVDQINMLVQLYKNKLPFSKRNMKYVKNIMLQKSNSNYVLRAKTGWGIRDNQEIGWYIGYVEVGGNAYFFATRIVSNLDSIPSSFSSSRKRITLEILKKLQYIK